MLVEGETALASATPGILLVLLAGSTYVTTVLNPAEEIQETLGSVFDEQEPTWNVQWPQCEPQDDEPGPQEAEPETDEPEPTTSSDGQIQPGQDEGADPDSDADTDSDDWHQNIGEPCGDGCSHTDGLCPYECYPPLPPYPEAPYYDFASHFNATICESYTDLALDMATLVATQQVVIRVDPVQKTYRLIPIPIRP